ncbi:hypothetical protein CPB86DRAFT_878439 [Serendipita vermifera]|nr:hypothetical protein CPB86DRAFT_878439 [Serendipita vermifera]
MFYHPAFRNLLLSIAITAVLFAFSRDTPTVVTIVVILIVNVASLLLFRRGSKSSVLSNQTSDSKRNDLGFKELSPGQDPVVDIIAIHGLDGHRERSWTAASGAMWLKDLLPLDIPNARILTYGYDSDTRRFTHTSKQSIFCHAETFVEDLILARNANPERPIIFIAHSLGGIILKKALALCNGANHRRDCKSITVSTYAVLFFGTPHSGANSVDLAQWMGKLLSVYMFTDDKILKDLDRDSTELQSIQTFYLGASERIKSIFFYEALPTSLVTGFAEVIVPRELAIIAGDRNAKVVELHGDHCEIVKYQERDDNDYRKVIGQLSSLVGEAPTEAAKNWSRENRHRRIDDGKAQGSHRILSKPLLAVSRNYIRRHHIEDFITEKLLPSDSSGLQPRCILHGLGGSGKTQAALYWIDVNRDKFTNLIFIDASSQKQIEADLETAIQSVSPEWSEATWQQAVAYLSRHKEWLLFFDNADSPDLRLEDYLPNSSCAAVLITTRNRDLSSYASDSHMQVGEMSEAEAVDLLHKVANVQPASTETSSILVKELGMLALAITQAGAYISKTRELDGYLSIFRKHRVKLMREPSLKGRNYDGSTYTAFDLSFGLLPKNAQDVMKIFAFLHHSRIPKALFKKSIGNHFRSYLDMKNYPPMPEMESLITDLAKIFGSEWDDFVFQELIDPILRGSLINLFDDDDEQILYNIHPLVQTYVQDLLAPADQDRYGLLTGQLLLGGIRPSEHNNEWDRKLLPHIDGVPLRVKQAGVLYADVFARVYRSIGRWRDNLELRRYCDVECGKEFGQRDSRVIRMRAHLGTALLECGQLEEAEKMERDVLEVQKEILGPRHPSTVTTMHNLASTLRQRGQLEEAEKMERDVLEVRKEILGPRHPKTVNTMHNLASTLCQRGQLEEAEKMERDVLEVRREILGPRHPKTVTTMHNLASTLRDRGQLEEAEKMEREVLEVRKEILGPRHPATVTTMSNLAYTLRDHGQPEEAEAIWREVLVLRKEVLGQWHPDTIDTMRALARFLHKRGQLEEAQRIERDLVALQKE